MGVVRLVLSLLVVASHVGGLGNTPAGGAAVGGFFVLSGFLMARTIVDNYSGSGALRFYANRIIRLVPPFAAALALTALVLWLRDSEGFAIKPNSSQLYMPVEFPERASEFVELNVHGAPNFVRLQIRLVPQAWSLLVEACFYLLAPLLVWMATRRLLPVIGLMAMGSFALAVQSSMLPAGADWLRSPTSSLWVFCLGMLVYFASPLRQASETTKRVARAVAILPILVLLPLAIGLTDLAQAAVLLVAPALVALWLALGQWTTRTGPAWDRTIGNFAYGVFLGHFLGSLVMYWLAEAVYRATGVFGVFGVPDEQEMRLRVFSYLFALVAGIALYYCFERPFEALRASLRRRRERGLPARAAIADVAR